jgi:CBS-domain-containing membrane protein
MKNSMTMAPVRRLVLDAETAADLMTRNPMSVAGDATLREAAVVLTQREISAAPVIDAAGHPVGVLSRTDIVRHIGDAASADRAAPFERSPEEPHRDARRADKLDQTKVRDIMTPAVLSVSMSSSVFEVVGMLLGVGRVHRLFVTDDDGVLVGVISAQDVLRKLRKGD